VPIGTVDIDYLVMKLRLSDGVLING